MTDGLPSNIVYDIYEDSRGMVWLATDAGLYEFIGEEILFRKELSRLQGERINSICEDKSGNLWLGAQGVGLCKFNGKKLSVFKLEATVPENDIECLVIDSIGENLVLGSSAGVFIYKVQNEDLQPVNSSWRKPVFKIRSYQNNFIVNTVAQEENIEFEIESRKLSECNSNSNLPAVKFGIQNNIIELKNILESGKQFTLEINATKKIFCDVVEMESNKNSSFYLLRYFDKEAEKQKVVKLSNTILSDFSTEKGLDEYFIHSIFLRKGFDDLWIGTHNHGLIQLQNSIFKYLDSSLLGIKNSNLQDLLCDESGNVVLVSEKELILLKDTQVQSRLSVNDFCSKYSSVVNCNNDFLIYKLGVDKEKLIWISTSVGFFTYEPNQHELRFVGISPANSFVFTEDDELLCFWQNKLSFYTKKGLLSQKPIFEFPKLANIGISKMIARDTAIWISTRQKGIIQFKNNEFRIFNKSNSKIHNVLNDILLLPDSTLVAGGNNGLIYKIKSKSNALVVVDSLTSVNGLVGTSIHGIKYLSDGSLWCGTNLGVYRFDYSSWAKNSELKLNFWNSKDGYFDQAGEQSVIDENQNIWVKTKNRLLKIETGIEKRRLFKSKIRIQSIEISNQAWEPDSTQVENWTQTPIAPIIFKYNENDITFTFGIDFCQNVSNVRFRYLLDGFDNKWSNWSNSSEAVFSHLPSGEYTLKVEGKHLSEGITIPFSVAITVQTPWWKMWWFIALSSLILCGIIYVAMWIYAYFIRKREKARTKQFNRVIGLKMRSLQNQLDPHFIFNSLNSIQSFILEENKEYALGYLSDFSNVLRKKIENANKDFISLSDEIAYLQLYLKLEQMRFSNKFSYKINVNSAINPYKLKLPPMLIQPFLENSIRYGIAGLKTNGNLQVNFEIEKDGYLRCIIIDNGIGRKEAKKLHLDSNIKCHHKTMTITKDRIKLLNKVLSNGRVYDYTIKDLENEEGCSRGTEVEIGFPKK
ncbi:hypothetical protein BZG02_14910 [Labilibaculum filiforme]|uniref:Signal transduction histidine kinase internal region domain-containing protein n=1 Tax=Labilibaculum filiforme TaxID=1940526 RepID=A0A2N3HUH4_9BACT|nr:histidine kinase [Labilibaculum filiforme]PKQ61712.1 hypothetical protein BZG02_14910 [Labilibaculum filiforme]